VLDILNNVVDLVTRLWAGWCRFRYPGGLQSFLFSKYFQVSWAAH